MGDMGEWTVCPRGSGKSWGKLNKGAGDVG